MKSKSIRKEDVNPNLLIYGKRLKDMNYTVQELSEILGVKPRYIREYLIGRKGAPAQPKANLKGQVFINGKELYEWAVEFHKKKLEKKEKNALKENEFLCCHCQKHVVPEAFSVEMSGSGTPFRKAFCPICGSRINRYMKKKD